MVYWLSSVVHILDLSGIWRFSKRCHHNKLKYWCRQFKFLPYICVVGRSRARRRPNFGFLMKKCPQRLWPRSAVNPRLSLRNCPPAQSSVFLIIFLLYMYLKNTFRERMSMLIDLAVYIYSQVNGGHISPPLWILELKYYTFVDQRMVFHPPSIQIQGIKLMVRWLLGVKNNQSKSGNSTLRMLTAILHSDGDLTEQGRMG